MPYNNNVPLGSQTVASSKDPIRNNFAFLQTDAQAEHSFNGNATGVAEGSHLRISMPNQANPAPGSLPAGTNGMFYMNSGDPMFFDNVQSNFLQFTVLLQEVTTGSVSLTTSSVNVVTLPNYSYGYYFISPISGSSTLAADASAVGFMTSAGTTSGFLAPVGSQGITVSISGRTLRARVDNPARAGVFSYSLIYFTP